jgi:hypothetical protein
VSQPVLVLSAEIVMTDMLVNGVRLHAGILVDGIPVDNVPWSFPDCM